MTHFDLFSGIGGFALAAKWAGFETVGFSEIDPFCCKLLEKNFPGIKNYGDIKQLEPISKVNLLTASPPCQPFSQAGNKKGCEDERHLWPYVRRFINSAKPDWAIIENVCGIISMELDNIIADLESEGYEPKAYIIPACSTNAPHRRDRVWIIAHYNSIRGDERQRDREVRYIQENFYGNLAQIQQKWSQLKPDTWSTYTARDWLDYNTRASGRNDGLQSRVDKSRIKALGNAIVPQVIYPIMEFIKLSYEEAS